MIAALILALTDIQMYSFELNFLSCFDEFELHQSLGLDSAQSITGINLTPSETSA